MAVTRCPNCGELSLTAVDVCPGCGAEMSEIEVAEPSPVSTGPAAHEQRELHEWTMEGRRLLDGMLERAGIPRSWQGTRLVTPAVEHDAVEEMVDLIGVGDARVGLDHDDGDGATDRDDDERSGHEDPQDDESDDAGEDGDDVAYDLTGWTDLARGDLVAALAEAEVEHGWDEDGDLVVGARDEGRVDRIFERLTTEGGATDDLPDDGFFGEIDDDGMLVQETLSDLFVGADRLRGNPLDGSAARLAIDGRDRARTLRLPYGFESTQWQRILAAAEELAVCFEPGAVDDDDIRERASALRALLRDVV